MQRGIVGLSVAMGLGCAGLSGPDPVQVAQVRGAVGTATPEAVVPLLIEGLVEAGAVWPPCADILGGLSSFDPAQRAVLLAHAVDSPFCSIPCGGKSMIGSLASMAPEARTAAVLSACDAEGPEPLFVGPLAPLRPHVPALEYLLVRELVSVADRADPEFSSVHDEIAVGLVLWGTPEGSAETRVEASRPVDTGPLLAAMETACKDSPPDPSSFRLVLDPRGEVAGWAGRGGNACLAAWAEAIELPAPDGSYTMIEASWRPVASE